jgi:hypothetical protein
VRTAAAAEGIEECLPPIAPVATTTIAIASYVSFLFSFYKKKKKEEEEKVLLLLPLLL